ncbi:hypothetical protein [Desulfofundulus kuznetsovii]|uniref:hypothetical protein n=1 Tax=Desulfofundulus kuznetsovii TaxID=58135 RepID=UPI00338E39F6
MFFFRWFQRCGWSFTRSLQPRPAGLVPVILFQRGHKQAGDVPDFGTRTLTAISPNLFPDRFLGVFFQKFFQEAFVHPGSGGSLAGWPFVFQPGRPFCEPPLVKSVAVSNRLGTKGISTVDDSVLSLAFQRKAILLTDDIRLRKKALGTSLMVHTSVWH